MRRRLLEAAQKDALLPPAQIAQLSKELDGKRRSVTVSRLVASAESRLASGRLVTPTDESAKDAIKALREAGASNELVARLNADLNQRLLAAARDAAARGDQAADADQPDAARDNGASAAALNAAQRDVTAAAQKQQRTTEDIASYAKAAQERLAAGSLLTPANDSAVSHAERLRLLDARNATTVQVVRDVRSRLLTEARATPHRKQADRRRCASSMPRRASVAMPISASCAPRWPAPSRPPRSPPPLPSCRRSR